MLYPTELRAHFGILAFREWPRRVGGGRNLDLRCALTVNRIHLLIALGAATFFVTCAGGWLALRLRKRLPHLLGFSAGVVIAVALLDLLPEAMITAASRTPSFIAGCALAGFLTYFLIDRYVLRPRSRNPAPADRRRAALFAGTLIVHSCLDGIAIGVASSVSVSLGLIVAVAVLSHDFCDGINTMNVALRGQSKFPVGWLCADALAPSLGIALTFLFTLERGSLGIMLAALVGMFLYIACAELLPASARASSPRKTAAASCIGAAAMAGIIYLGRAI